MDIFILNSDLERIGVVENYKSFIWSQRYAELGDCELYVPATIEGLQLFKINNYIMRSDDLNMVCIIKRVELTTDVNEGNYLIVTGTDAKILLDQRIIWGTATCNGKVESFIRNRVANALGSGASSARMIKNSNNERIFYLGTSANLPDVATEQTSYANLGEKIRDYCAKYGWGYRIRIADEKLYFELYNGADRSNTVVFSDNYENLASTSYSEDETNMGNVALIGGEGEGTKRTRQTVGTAQGVNRYEIFVDARDISRVLSYDELKSMYPLQAQGGQGYISNKVYYMAVLDVLIMDAAQLAKLQTDYPNGQIVTISGIDYYEIENVGIADLPSNAPDNGDECKLKDVIYLPYLMTAGYEGLAEFGAVTAFEGTIEPSTTFKYKTDYFLGDIVTVSNSFGISVGARISEIVEVYDENGYSVAPAFQYINQEGING